MSFSEVRYTDHMRSIQVLIAALAVAAVAVHAQSPKKPKTVTISGCVERDAVSPEQFTIVDKTGGMKYRVTGKDFREYLGRPVQLDGGVVVKGVKISGGLQPNPNIAAQAGAIDPSRAAVQAATSGATTGPDTDIQEFRVKDVKAIGGTCAEK